MQSEVVEDTDRSAWERLGPPSRTREEMTDASPRCRGVARDEYNRTLREFRETGTAREKTTEDFAHLINPEGAAVEAFLAHCEALEAIERWREMVAEESKSGRDETPAAPLRVEGPQSMDDVVSEENETRNMTVSATEETNTAGSSDGALDMEDNPTTKLVSVALRGEVFDPRATGLKEWDRSHPVLALRVAEETRRVFRQPLTGDETESLLNAMIGEMHFNMREVAFRSMCQATELDDRMRWVDATVKMAEAGAKVGETIGHLRGGGVPEGGRRARSNAK